MMASATFRIFCNDTWKNWDKTGKAEVVKKIQQLINEADANNGTIFAMSTKDCDNGISRALYEIVSAVIRGYLRRDFAKSVLSEMLNLHQDLGSLLIEVFSVIELEVTTMDRLKKQREELLALVKLLNLDKLYRERLEIDTLGDAGIIKNKKNFLTKQIKVRTKMFYKQQKFNLLREESEGYSKLITELNQELTDSITASSIIEVIRSLIGCFNLDPNRVLDLILEAFENRPEEHKFYTALLLQFPHESATISELLGFKLQNYADNGKEIQGMYTVMALLLQNQILSMSDVYDWLKPEDSTMIEDHKTAMDEAKEYSNKASVVSTKDKEKEKEKVEEENGQVEERLAEKNSNNQKISLAVAFLEVGNWEHFVSICRRFPNFYLVSCAPVAKALCKLIQILIDPVHKNYSGLPSRLKRNTEGCTSDLISSNPVKTFEEMIDVVFPMLTVLGPYIYHDVKLIYRLLRLSRTVLKEETNLPAGERTKIYYEILTMMDDSILPALSMLDANPCIAEEIWETFKLFDYQHRYKLYSTWKNDTYIHHPALIRNRTNYLKKAKYIMMRITKETIKPVSRCIGKLTHNFPGPIFEYILKQVQLYDNLIGPVVDSFKYLTSLSYDVLSYCMVEMFCSSTERTLNDGIAIAPWLQSLSGFTGSVCKKYPMDLGGILQFVANQLKCQRSIDLLVLKDIVQKMGGADSMEDLTPEQLDAMCGGELLRREAGQYLQEKNTKRSSLRLKEALLENNLAIPLLLLMAQQRASIVYNQTETPHLKLVGKLYDQCQGTMVQFGTFISQVVTIEEMSSKLPLIGDLLSEYHIDTDVAFFLARPMSTHLLHNKYDELRRKDRSEKKHTIEDKKRMFMDACSEVFSPVVASIKPHYSNKVWEDIDPNFFLTFWTFSMSDLEVPTAIYEKEIKKLVDMPNSKTRKRDLERITSLKEKLEDERKKQLEHVDRVQAWLMKEKDTWFKQRTPRSPKNDTVTTFLQHCIFPRCTFTTLDAIYCAKFVKMLHNLKTPNFSTLLCYDRMYCDITYTVTSCTEQETHHYAKFLLGTLETVMHWHSSQENFEKECSNCPGFITRYRISTHEANDYVDYENYRHVVHKWHFKITKALVTCLESGDFIQIRNSIFILQGILPCFPVIINLASVIEKRIEKVKTAEKSQRNDLYVLANSYSGRLKAKKATLMHEKDFHVVRKPETTLPTKPVPSQNASNTDTTDKVKPKKETNEVVVNGEEKSKEDGTVKSQKTADSHNKNIKEEKRTHDGEIDGKDSHAEKEKKKKERKDERVKDEKPKKKRDVKKLKNEDSTEQETLDDREDNATTNGTVKMEPPVDEVESSRSSKRRKVEVDSKVSIRSSSAC